MKRLGRERLVFLALGVAALLPLSLTACGSSDSSTGSTSASEPLAEIQIEAPASGTTVGSENVTVKGTVTPNVPYEVRVGSNITTGESATGDWKMQVLLADGENKISAVAKNSDGTVGGTAGIRVFYDESVTPTAAATAPKPKKKKKKKKSCITVPDVVGQNHQYAQDDIQAAGLYNLREKDATGQGRMLLWDRNWEVVTQNPGAGACVSENTTVTLSSNKIGE